MTDEGSVAAPPSPTPSAAVWEDFIDIFYEPSRVFERRRGWSAWPVLLVLTLVLVGLFYAWQQALGPLLDVEMQRAMSRALAQNPEVSQEQLQRVQAMGRIFALISFAVAFPVGVAIAALVTWALARIAGGVTGVAAMIMVVTYAQMVRIPQYVVGVLQSLVLDMNRLDSIHDVSFSLARFLDQPDTSNLVLQLAARVDVFTLWATVLIAIGLRVVTGLPRARAWTVAAVVWLLGAVPPLIGTLSGGGGS